MKAYPPCSCLMKAKWPLTKLNKGYTGLCRGYIGGM